MGKCYAVLSSMKTFKYLVDFLVITYISEKTFKKFYECLRALEMK